MPNPCEIDLDFGDLPVGSISETLIAIENTGAVPLNLVNEDLFPSQDFVVLYDPPASIAPNRSYIFTVGFEPATEGEAYAAFAIETDGINRACDEQQDALLTLYLVGTGLHSQ